MKITLRNTILKNKNDYDAILNLIKKHDRIIIYRHIKPDFDALGSQVGLYIYLKKNFADKEIYMVGDNHDDFTNKIYPKMDTLSDTFLNEKPFLAIILDVNKKSRVADPRYEKATDIIKLDHHPKEDDKGTIFVIDPLLSSCAELVSSMLIYFTRKYHYRFPRLACNYLYSGIVGDSGRFLYLSTSPLTFEVSSFLIRKGINISTLYSKMYDKDIADLEFTKHVLNNYHHTKKGVCYYILTTKDLKKLNLTTQEGKEKLGLFGNINKVHIWCSITEDNSPNDHCFRISLRSKKVDISGVASKYEGGAHPQASGAKIYSLDEVPQFVSDLEALL